MSGTILFILLIVFLLYCFVGIWSFIPYVLGFLPGCITFFVDIFKFNIYPVGDFVYWVITGTFLVVLVNFFIIPFIGGGKS